MSTRDLGWTLVGLGTGIIAGTLYNWVEATYHAEKKARETFDEQLEIHKRILQRSYEKSLDQIIEQPAQSEEDLVAGVEAYLGEVKTGGEIVLETGIERNLPPDYVGTAALYADPGTFINGEQVQSLVYIEPEDYEEEDGRAKEQITIFMGGDEAIFVMDGEQITNWAELIGEHILVDFYKMVPPETQDRVLYVRNHKRDEDYEVWQTVP